MIFITLQSTVEFKANVSRSVAGGLVLTLPYVRAASLLAVLTSGLSYFSLVSAPPLRAAAPLLCSSLAGDLKSFEEKVDV